MYMTADYECSCGPPVQKSAQPSSPSPSSGGRGSTKRTMRGTRVRTKTNVRKGANDGEDDDQDHSNATNNDGCDEFSGKGTTYVSETDLDEDDEEDDEEEDERPRNSKSRSPIARKQAKVDETLQCMCNPPCDLQIGSVVAIVPDDGGVGSGM